MADEFLIIVSRLLFWLGLINEPNPVAGFVAVGIFLAMFFAIALLVKATNRTTLAEASDQVAGGAMGIALTMLMLGVIALVALAVLKWAWTTLFS